jgi:hypothetical protein
MNDPYQSLQRQTSGLTALLLGHGPPAPARRAALFPIKGCAAVAFAQWPWSTELRAEPGRRPSMTPIGMVQKVDFVGGWVTGARTDTEVWMVFVRRVARFQPGMAVKVLGNCLEACVRAVGSDDRYRRGL